MNIKLIVNSAAALSILLASVCQADPASGMATGKRQHKPITVIKSIDKATPVLAGAAHSNGREIKAGHRLCPDGSMINPGEKCPEKKGEK